ncbi:MAG TPA: SMP-30/gluconolactonase/LRE family protein [Candidatus Cloacimonadota bacterium]|nr:SMP-30/gluconolactonase/LRE family protein [Candidatus Cloacimonadota bacterium]HQL14812.1 SMP-30/gluconolactonase/LRE family protein [Candidatus Cloacimonadota bacterium]
MRKFIVILFTVMAVTLACQKEDPYKIINPESVTWNPATHTYLISVSGTGRILSLKDKSQFSVFNQKMLSSPKGMAVLNDTLFVADHTRLVGLNINNGKQLFAQELPNAKFLNDVTVAPNGTVYVSDNVANCIYIVHPASKQATVFKNKNLSAPNGLYYVQQNNKPLLYIVSFRQSAPVQILDLTNNSLTSVPNTEISLADGITRDENANWLISSWADSTIYRFNADFSQKSRLQEKYDSPADIYYNLENKELAIPEFNTNLIKFIPSTEEKVKP